jgi:hypothetical protein
MTNLALTFKSKSRTKSGTLIPAERSTLLTPANDNDLRISGWKTWSPTALTILAVTLIILQLLDGILTCSGIYAFGLTAEGNPLMRTLISLLGIIPAVTISKLVCISVVLGLCAQAREIYWLPFALSCVGGIYLIAAVIPWSLLIIGHVLG